MEIGLFLSAYNSSHPVEYHFLFNGQEGKTYMSIMCYQLKPVVMSHFTNRITIPSVITPFKLGQRRMAHAKLASV